MTKHNRKLATISSFQKTVLILLGILSTLIIIELGLRLGGFIIVSLQEHRNLQAIKQKGAYRILCIGESTTHQWPLFLEQILNQSKTGIQFSVIDKGMGGINTSNILSQLDSNLDEYRPDMVVAMMGINDAGPHMPYEAISTSKVKLFFRSFRTYKLTRLLWLHMVTKAREIGLYKQEKRKQLTQELRSHSVTAEIKHGLPKKPESSSSEQCSESDIGLNSPNEQAYIQLGRKLYRNHANLVQAEAAFKKAIELDPRNDAAYIELGRFYRDYYFKPSEAEAMFKKAIELNPRNDATYIDLGWCQDNPDEAEAMFKKAIEFNPNNDKAYLELGCSYRRRGKLSQAEEAFKKAIEVNPANDLAYIELGPLYRDQKKFSQAEEIFKKAEKVEPRNDRILGALWVLYDEMNEPKLAEEYEHKTKELRNSYYDSTTVKNFRLLKEILDNRKIRFICVQYPVRSIDSLKRIFADQVEGIIFVSNEYVFKEALKKAPYREYFVDAIGGDFGHCTDKGNKLLAENIAHVLLKEVFDK